MYIGIRSIVGPGATWDDLSQAQVQQYSTYLHNMVFTPEDPTNVREVVGDGNAKAVMKCGHATGRRVGRPRKDTNIVMTGLAHTVGSLSLIQD